MPELIANYRDIHSSIVELLESSRRHAARSVNALMTATYWQIGKCIVESEQEGAERARYGQVLIERLAKDLTASHGRGFSHQNLWQMRAFYLGWPKTPILQTPSGESQTGTFLVASKRMPDTQLFPLPWSAYVRLLGVKNPIARAFYEAEALRCGWSVRQLDRQVNSQFYERSALSKNQTAMLTGGQQVHTGDAMTIDDVIKDPFVLEFLDLKDEYSESDLEDGLIRHLTDFLLELGDDFSFVGRQRRLRVDDTWLRVDLLFFHRLLKCLIVIELKTGKFSYADAGQMHLYLNYARENWSKPGENPPVGLILCAAAGAAEAHYALDNLPNQVLAAEYRTILPNEEMLAKELERSRREIGARQKRSAASDNVAESWSAPERREPQPRRRDGQPSAFSLRATSSAK